MITIIIPTYERSRYLKRALSYWLAYPVNIIVVDGSESPSIDISLFKNYRYLTYCHMPVSIEKRLAYAATILTGSYAIQISDDEFLSYDALVAAAKLLTEQNTVSAVLGATLAFKIIDNKFFSSIWYSSSQSLSICGANPSERLKQRCTVQGNSIYYSLLRVEVMRAALLMIGEHHYSCPYVSEYQMEAMICHFGSVKVMPQLMWFRSHEVPMINNPSNNRNIFFSDWIEDPKNRHEIEILRKSLNSNFNRAGYSNGNISPDEFINLFAKYESNNLRHSLKNSIYKIFKNFKFTKQILSHFNKLRGEKLIKFYDLDSIKNKLYLNNIKYNYLEIDHISNIVISKEKIDAL